MSEREIQSRIERLRRESYWQRVEVAARERWAKGRFVTLAELVADARDLIAEIDRQKEAEQP